MTYRYIALEQDEEEGNLGSRYHYIKFLNTVTIHFVVYNKIGMYYTSLRFESEIYTATDCHSEY